MISPLYALLPQWARGLSAKIYSIVFLAILGIGAITFQASLASKHDLEKSKATELQHLVQSALTAVSALHDDAKSGVISEEKAKEAAKDLLSKLRYDGKHYFWINDMNHRILMHGTDPSTVGKNYSEAKDPMVCITFRNS